MIELILRTISNIILNHFSSYDSCICVRTPQKSTKKTDTSHVRAYLLEHLSYVLSFKNGWNTIQCAIALGAILSINKTKLSVDFIIASSVNFIYLLDCCYFQSDSNVIEASDTVAASILRLFSLSNCTQISFHFILFSSEYVFHLVVMKMTVHSLTSKSWMNAIHFGTYPLLLTALLDEFDYNNNKFSGLELEFACTKK